MRRKERDGVKCYKFHRTRRKSDACGESLRRYGFDKATYWGILRKQLSVFGTWNSSFVHSENDDWHYVLELLETEDIKPQELISHVLDFDKLIDGFEIIRNKKEDYIKIMIAKKSIYVNND